MISRANVIIKSLLLSLTATVALLPMVGQAADLPPESATALANAARDCKAIHDIVVDIEDGAGRDATPWMARSVQFGDLYQELTGLWDSDYIIAMDAARAAAASLDFVDEAYRDMATACAADVDARLANAKASEHVLP